VEFGQWLGPWDIEQLVNPGLPPGSPANDDLRDWGESVHAVVLPPREAGAKTLVLMVCRRKDGPECAGNGGDVSSKAFLLDPDDPMALQTMVVNDLTGSIDLGARDPFCGGHVLTAAGDVFWASGTDVAAEANDCSGTPYGHEYAYLVAWNDTAHAWEWQPAGTMGDPRWYASLTTLPDGRKLISGHLALPISTPPATETHEYVTIDGTTVTWATPGLAPTNDRLNACQPNPPTLSLLDYPHLHVVRAQRVMWTGRELNGVFTDAFLRLDACSPTAERWIDRIDPAGPHPRNAGLNSVHVINLARTPPVEAVYSVGGAQHDSASSTISAQVLEMVNPSETASWDDSPPDLNANVIDANTVILLDGSFGRFGGYGAELDESTPDQNDYTYPARRKPERYKPPEVFANPGTTWGHMARENHERRYHSWAVLMPDGSVVVGGGDDLLTTGVDAVDPSWYSIEVFRPPYFFPSPRPRITAAPTSIAYPQPNDLTFPLSAILRTTSLDGEFRVALVGPGSATHGVNFSQRYVVLDVDKLASTVAWDPNEVSTLQVKTSFLDSWVAPPGWYLLTVVNSSGIPAAAKWVTVVVP